MRIALTLAMALFLIPACGGGGSSGAAPSDGAWIVHGVVATEGLPAGVAVYLEGDLDAEAVTDHSGRFRFEGVPNGRYRVVPAQGGFDFDPDYYDLVIAGKQPGALAFHKSTLSDPSPPSDPVRLVLVHHETGALWLDPPNGNLAANLANQRYDVRNVTYGWDAPENPDIGDATDIGEYWTWFADLGVQANGQATRDNIAEALYATDARSGRYPTPLPDPGGPNDVIVLMTPPENNAVGMGDEDRLEGLGADSSTHTVGGCRAVYGDLLDYFRSRPDKLFVIVTAPPLVDVETTIEEAGRARVLNDWLVHDWLRDADWANRNVYVWDLFNVLTSDDNHHRFDQGRLVHEQVDLSDSAAYPRAPGDSLPDEIGCFKATSEFVPVLNVFFNRWQHWRAVK